MVLRMVYIYNPLNIQRSSHQGHETSYPSNKIVVPIKVAAGYILYLQSDIRLYNIISPKRI